MTSGIRIAKDLELPVEVSTLKFALLAQSGRGKTRASKKLVEGFIGAGVQTIVIDPVGVWYGLRLAANGKAPGLSIPVLGGYHGDVPLLPTGGAVVAEALARTGSSAVLDMTRFDTGADARRFITAFAETFFRAKAKHPSPVHLVLEEADEWVPQNPAKDEAKMLGAFQRIARIGRNFGIGFTVISQRPQGLSKKVLNLADVLVVLGLSGAHERKAISEWMVDKDIDAAQRAAILADLPNLGWNKVRKVDNGALFWSPVLELFGKHTISAPTTFDSSATPEAGAKRVERELAHLDIGKLNEAMHATLEEAKSNDPAQLRKRVADLERQVATAPKAEVKSERVEVPVISDAQMQRLEKSIASTKSALDEVVEWLQSTQSRLEPVLAEFEAVKKRIAEFAPISLAWNSRFTEPSAPARPRPHKFTIKKTGDVEQEFRMTGSRQRLLDELVWLESIGIPKATRGQLAVIADVPMTSGGFKNNLSALCTANLISYPESNVVQLTAAGRALAAPVPRRRSLDDLHTGVLVRLKPESKADLLRALISAHPRSLSREDLSNVVDVPASSGGFKNNLSSLHTLGLVTYPTKGEVRAADVLFIKGAA